METYNELRQTWLAAWFASDMPGRFERWASDVSALHPADEYEVARVERVLGVEAPEMEAVA